MGFFKIFDLDHGNDPGAANGANRYIPITILDANAIRRESAQTGDAIGQIVEEKSQQITAVLTQEVDGDLHDTLAYAIREILRNAVEHSHSDCVRFCAQLYPRMDRVEVVILDKGRGILPSFAMNPFVDPSTDREAINISLMPGVSGTAFKGSKINTRTDDWKNSGYGLYMTNRICRMGGDFFIGSNSAGVLLEDGKKIDYRFHHQGTLLRLTIKPSRVANLKSRLLEFSEQGKASATRLRGTVLHPSTASHMLTVDYQDS
ncbi:ATP-binding protein [Rubritalea spongiae]|uniref:ATP-binding protein n=1 Tax=Rubritalea spongiae TaxID=430797 RepID=A0ABW5E527_9BACT